MMKASTTVPAALRIAMGWTFFWPFLDKMFGLGFSTASGKSWLDGVSPTAGFLGRAVKGPFAPMYHALAGSTVVDVLFMAGLGLIGLTLILGIAHRIAGISGAVLMVLMFLALIQPVQNPLIDEHIIYALVLLWLAAVPAIGETWGLGGWWKGLAIVKKNAWLA